MKGALASVAAQYAEAALSFAEDSEDKTTPVKVLNDLAGIKEVFGQTPELDMVLRNPSIPSADKKNLLIKTFQGKIHEVTLRLVELLVDRRRLDLIDSVESKFRDLVRERQNIVSASLTSSQELTQGEIADIKARLTEHLGKKLELDVKIDKSLLGGVVLRLGDQVIDGSLKGKLATLEKQLLSV
jgi:F-type H+-transporting ATPase subunit delta